MHKTTGDVWDQWRLVIRGLGPIEISNSDANYVVLHAKNDRWGLGPMETSNSGANHADLHAQNDRWVLEQ